MLSLHACWVSQESGALATTFFDYLWTFFSSCSSVPKHFKNPCSPICEVFFLTLDWDFCHWLPVLSPRFCLLLFLSCCVGMMQNLRVKMDAAQSQGTLPNTCVLSAGQSQQLSMVPLDRRALSEGSAQLRHPACLLIGPSKLLSSYGLKRNWRSKKLRDSLDFRLTSHSPLKHRIPQIPGMGSPRTSWFKANKKYIEIFQK